ncbi:MAG: DinB family protein [Ignavibacteria bacterium]|nr:DinB family protein [Ignavibacteria bacterium]
MTRNKFIANRLREVLLSGRWIANTNYKEQLLSVTHRQAKRKIGSLNSIAELTYHVNYYLSGILNIFKSGKLEIQDKYSFDMPALCSEKDWENLVNEFLSNSEKLTAQIDQLPDEIFDEIFADEKYGTYQRNLEGVIEHSYYHLGQISLIKKLISEIDN